MVANNSKIFSIEQGMANFCSLASRLVYIARVECLILATSSNVQQGTTRLVKSNLIVYQWKPLFHQHVIVEESGNSRAEQVFVGGHRPHLRTFQNPKIIFWSSNELEMGSAIPGYWVSTPTPIWGLPSSDVFLKKRNNTYAQEEPLAVGS